MVSSVIFILEQMCFNFPLPMSSRINTFRLGRLV